MIHCKKCHTPNPPEHEKCQQCNANLLPGDSLLDRMGTLLGGIFAAAIALLLAVASSRLPEDLPECLPASPPAWLFVSAVCVISAICSVVRRTPLYLRFAKRAQRHLDLDPEQALQDFSAALEAAPEKKRASLLQERAALYQRLGRESEAVQDLLDYTLDESAYQTGSGIAFLVGADQESYVSSVAKSERRKMIADGKVLAVGYCSKCTGAVELTPDLRCKTHKSIRGREVQYGIPDAARDLMSKARKEYETKRRKRRKWLVGLGLMIGIPVVLCLLSVVLVQVIP